MRLCVVRRERLPRNLLWRVVRERQEDGSVKVRFNEGHGRSAYVCKDLQSVQESIRHKRLNKALKASVPRDVQTTLEKMAREWDKKSDSEKGFLYCEVFGVDGVSSAVEELQLCGGAFWDDFSERD